MTERDCTPIESLPPEADIPVENNRRLISGLGKIGMGQREFIDVRSGERHIAIPRDSATYPLHRELAKRHVPVFPLADVRGDEVLLDIPSDARTLDASLKFISRDIPEYRPIFEQLGEMLGRVQASGLGVPEGSEDRKLLQSVAFFSSNEVYGGSVALIPPYNLAAVAAKQDTIELVEQELLASEYIVKAQAVELARAVDEGWNAVRR